MAVLGCICHWWCHEQQPRFQAFLSLLLLGVATCTVSAGAEQCPSGYYRASTVLYNCACKGFSNPSTGHLFLGPQVTAEAVRIPKGMKNWYVTVQSDDNAHAELEVIPSPVSWRQRETIHDVRVSESPYKEKVSCDGEAPDNLVIKISNRGSSPTLFSLRTAFQYINGLTCPSPAIFGCLRYDAAATMMMMREWSAWLDEKFNSSIDAWNMLQRHVPPDSPNGWTWSSWASVWNLWESDARDSSILQTKPSISRLLTGIQQEGVGWMTSFYFLDRLGTQDNVVSLVELGQALNFHKVYAKQVVFAEKLSAFENLDAAWAGLAGISKHLISSLQDVPSDRWEVSWNKIHLPLGVSVHTVQELLRYLGVHTNQTGTVTKAQMEPVYDWGVALKAWNHRRNKLRSRSHAQTTEKQFMQKQLASRPSSSTTTTTVTHSVLAAPVQEPVSAFRIAIPTALPFRVEIPTALPLDQTRAFKLINRNLRNGVAAGIAVLVMFCMVCCLILGRKSRTIAPQQSRDMEGRLARYQQLSPEREGDKSTMAVASVFDQRLLREQAAGGAIQISLVWNTKDDLDLHCTTPVGEEIWYSHRTSSCGGTLDVDMNAGTETSQEPVENIFWAHDPPTGIYEVSVVNYHYKQTPAGQPIPFTLRMKFRRQDLFFEGKCTGEGKESHISFSFNYDGPHQYVEVPTTKLKAPAAAGSTVLAVVSSAGFTMGDPITIGSGTQTETNRFAGFGPVTYESMKLQQPLRFAHPTETTLKKSNPDDALLKDDVSEDTRVQGGCCCPASSEGAGEPLTPTKPTKGVSEFRVASPNAMLTNRMPDAHAVGLSGAGVGALAQGHDGTGGNSATTMQTGVAGIVADSFSQASSESANAGVLLQLQSPGASLTKREIADLRNAGVPEAELRGTADNPGHIQEEGTADLWNGDGFGCGDDRVVNEAPLSAVDAAREKKKCRCCRAPCVCGGRKSRDKT